MPGKYDSGEKVPHQSTSSPVTSLHVLLHRTRTPGSTLNTTPLLRQMDRDVTTCHLPSHTVDHGHIRRIPHTRAPRSCTMSLLKTHRTPTLQMDKQSTRTSPKAQRTIVQPLNTWSNHTRHTTHDEHKHGLINY